MIKFRIVKSEFKRNNVQMRGIIQMVNERNNSLPDGLKDALVLMISNYEKTCSLLGNAIQLEEREEREYFGN